MDKIEFNIREFDVPNVIEIVLIREGTCFFVFYVDLEEQQVWKENWGDLGDLRSFFTSKENSLFVEKLVSLGCVGVNAEEVRRQISDEVASRLSGFRIVRAHVQREFTRKLARI